MSPSPDIPVPEILFEDPNLIVIIKPAGLLSQGEHKGDPNVVDWMRTRLGRPYVGLVHRLDRNTSGVMIVAKRTKAAERLSRALQDGSLDRTYLALIVGRLDASARWEHWLRRDEKQNISRVVARGAARPPTQNAKQAVLSVTPRGYGAVQGKTVTLAEFRLETGRSHQIRAQCAAEQHPIVGDRKYGGEDAALGFTRPALHSHRIRFPHPIGGKVLEFEAPLPADIMRAGIRYNP